MELGHLERIIFDPAIMGGKPCIRGMRVTVGMIASGHDRAQVLALYPYLEPDDIAQARSYAAWWVEEVAFGRPSLLPCWRVTWRWRIARPAGECG